MTTNTNEVGKFESMADSIPVSSLVIPPHIRMQLCSVVARGQKSTQYEGYKIANDALCAWLSLHLGLCTDDNAYQLSGGAFTVDFDWHIQKWVVRA